jgi:BNR repeat-like domain
MTSRTSVRRALFVAALSTLSLLGAVSHAAANVPLTRVSADPFTNPTSQHATEVEPDTFASGRTVVAAFQVGRFFNGGSTDIGFARSTDGGATWGPPGFLAGTTSSAGFATRFERVSDASVAFDRKHGVWLISSIPILPNTVVPTVFVHRSTDGGQTFGQPVQIPPPVSNSVNLDKNWTVCDNTRTSPFFGHCYTELDNFGDGDLELMSTSTDGGLTWSVPIPTAGNDKGLGGQPVVQPNGTVIVPFEALNGKIAAFRSTNGGASWTRAVNVSSIRFHAVAGGLRTSPLPTAEIDKVGNVYVAWEDCRFRRLCPSNDIVFSRSSDGVAWTDAARVPIDAVTSTVDHFIPGLAVDPTTSGTGAHLALTYYFYPTAACGGACRLQVGYISSPDGGAHWSAPTQLAGPMALSEIANTSQGPMVGDYISTSFAGATAATVFAVGVTPTAATFDEAMYAPATPLAVASAAQATRPSSSAGVVVPVTGVGTGATHQALKNN